VNKPKHDEPNEIQFCLRRILERSKPFQPSPYREPLPGQRVGAHQQSASVAVR
jgi:hypothetical protein